MQFRNFNVYFFFLILLLVSVVSFLIVKPFWSSIVMAAVLAIVFHRPYELFLRLTKERKGTSSLLACLFAAFVIIIPLFLVLELLAVEAANLYQRITADGGLTHSLIRLQATVLQSLPFLSTFQMEEVLSPENVTSSIKSLGQNFFSIVQAVYQGIVGIALWFLITLLTLFFFFIHGKEIVAQLMRLSPLRNHHEKLLVEKFVSISRATLKGTVVVGIVQGILGGLMFALTGVPSPVVWGSVMAVFSLVPMVGASIVWFPAGVIMLLLGNIWQGIFILGFGVGIISTIDNFIRSKLVGKETQMHPLLVFFATLGGLSLFGPVGLIIGPIIVALFLVLWDIYAVEFKQQLAEYNK